MFQWPGSLGNSLQETNGLQKSWIVAETPAGFLWRARAANANGTTCPEEVSVVPRARLKDPSSRYPSSKLFFMLETGGCQPRASGANDECNLPGVDCKPTSQPRAVVFRRNISGGSPHSCRSSRTTEANQGCTSCATPLG